MGGEIPRYSGGRIQKRREGNVAKRGLAARRGPVKGQTQQGREKHYLKRIVNS